MCCSNWAIILTMEGIEGTNRGKNVVGGRERSDASPSAPLLLPFKRWNPVGHNCNLACYVRMYQPLISHAACHQMHRAQLHNHVRSVKIVIFLAQAQLVHDSCKKISWSFVGFKCHIIVQVNQSVSSQNSGGTVEELPLIICNQCVVL